ncbi:hypothetical protein DIPPA_18724 [Diplonema papillatum]|nr:hypothetical protein DIPPA_18724 [Diplonema papillatum]
MTKLTQPASTRLRSLLSPLSSVDKRLTLYVITARIPLPSILGAFVRVLDAEMAAAHLALLVALNWWFGGILWPTLIALELSAFVAIPTALLTRRVRPQAVLIPEYRRKWSLNYRRVAGESLSFPAVDLAYFTVAGWFAFGWVSLCAVPVLALARVFFACCWLGDALASMALAAACIAAVATGVIPVSWQLAVVGGVVVTATDSILHKYL